MGRWSRSTLALALLMLGCSSDSGSTEAGVPLADAGSTGGSGGDGGSNGSSFDGGSSNGSAGADVGANCSALRARIRDFQTPHPDFETYAGKMETTGLVQSELGSDHKPVFAMSGSPTEITSAQTFAQWYNDRPDTNLPINVDIMLTDSGDGRYTYDSAAFFPIDNMGFGNQGRPHNFHFTTEVHTQFTYKGGETFKFTGDDDLWLFINNKLAIDLGGLHPARTKTVDLDQSASMLGITKGNPYPMEIFHAERHTSQSNFHIETTIDCFKPVMLQ